MNYIIGALFGILLVLLVLGGFTYFHYLEVESIQQEVDLKTTNDYQRVKSSSQSSNTNSKPNQKQVATKPNQTNTQKPSNTSKPVIYTWTDSSGNKRFSEKPPTTGNYQVQDLSGEGFSVIPMERTEPIQRSTASNRQANNSYQNPAMIKQQLLSQNHTHCRWLVGRTYETYLKIEEHTGPNRSIYCDEYKERLIEMRKLAREGEACYYPYGYTSKC